MNLKSSSLIWVARRAGLLLVGVGLSWLAALTLCAKDAPKLSVSDRPVDRSARGASYSAVIKRVQPSVVTIYSTRTTRLQQRHPFMDDPMFRQFFGEDENSGSNFRKRSEQSLGSGVIVSEDGYILTNNHVVDGADADGVKIALADGKTKLDARVIGKDPLTDIAVLKVDGKKLSAITLADSDLIEVGDVVFAIGNPFGVGQSVSMGIISAMGRGEMPFGNMAVYEDFIQTDAAINQGNSGGALVDAEGRLIGINQSIVSGSGANAGVGFAIPVNLSRSVLEGLSANGKMTRGFLGVEREDITPGLAKAFGLPDASGVLITKVVTNSPAARAGVQREDVIVEFNGKKISDSRHLGLVVSQISPETKVIMKVIRDREEKRLNVTVGAQPQWMAGDTKEEESMLQPVKKPNGFLDGVEITTMGRGVRRQYRYPEDVRGVLVTNVDPDSKAAEAELRVGDVIEEINRHPVRTAEEAANVVSASKDESILFRVYRPSRGGGTTRYVVVETGRK